MRAIGGLIGFAGLPTGRIGFCTGIAGGGATGRCGGLTIGCGACAGRGGTYPGLCCGASPVTTHSRPTSSYRTGALPFKVICAGPLPTPSALGPCEFPPVISRGLDDASPVAFCRRAACSGGTPKTIRVNPRSAADPPLPRTALAPGADTAPPAEVAPKNLAAAFRAPPSSDAAAFASATPMPPVAP